MANWTDGPEYAPAERPNAFETPLVAPLEVPPSVPNLAAGAPLGQPTWQPPQQAVAPLSSLVPAAAVPPRDPLSEFSTVSSTMTGDAGAWSSAHSATGTLPHLGWTPDQPLITSGVSSAAGVPGATGVTGVTGAPNWPAPLDPAAPPASTRGLNFPPPQQSASSFPQPGTPDWFAPPPQGQWRPPDQSVTFADMWRAATPGMMIALIVGAVWSPLSVIMLGVAALLAGRVRYRLAHVRRAFNWSFTLLAVIGALALYTSNLDLDTAWSVLSGWAQAMCWVVGIAAMLLVGAGIRAHEPPSQP